MNVSSGVINQAAKLLLYGVEGIGKTTLISKLVGLGLKPLFFDSEAGTLKVNCERVGITDLASFEANVAEFVQGKHDFKTLVIDTVTGLEPQVEIVILERTRKRRMGDFEYGRGSVLLREEFDRLLYEHFDAVVRAGYHVVLIGHAQIVRTQLPELLNGFDRYELAMDKKVSATLRQWSDHVLFCNWDFAVVENERSETRGVQGKGRAIFTTHSAAFDAKNRSELAPKLDWKIESLAPLFNPVSASRPISPEHEKLWVEFQAAFAAVNPETLAAFLKTRFPAFTPENFTVIGPNYLKAALARQTEFRQTIDEFSKPTASA
jgi:hypothetical protein